MKLKSLRLFAALTIVAITSALITTSCSNEIETEDQSTDTEKIEGYKQIFSNPKFAYYESNVQTRAGNKKQLIKVTELPKIDIFFQKNDSEAFKEYDYKSVFEKKGRVLCTLYTSIEKTETGFIVKYNRDGEDYGTSYLPIANTRGWFDDTTDCLADVYMNHGWKSTLLIMATALLPEAGVAMTAACAIVTIPL